MAWGLEEKLKDHADTIDRKFDLKLESIQGHVEKVDKEFNIYKLECMEHRRRADDWTKAMTLSQQSQEISLENTERNVQCIKNILETYLPNLKDAEEKRATKHQLKEGALWVSAIIGALLALAGLVAAIWLYAGNAASLFTKL